MTTTDHAPHTFSDARTPKERGRIKNAAYKRLEELGHGRNSEAARVVRAAMTRQNGAKPRIFTMMDIAKIDQIVALLEGAQP